MVEFKIVEPLIGGALIGLAASGMLWSNGRVMGISGILGGVLTPSTRDKAWRALFLLGMLAGGFLIPFFGFSVMQVEFDRTLTAAIVGGLIVGIGTTIGNGCTSGHGVCGLSRLSPRSMVATITFMLFGFAMVYLIGSLFGGKL